MPRPSTSLWTILLLLITAIVTCATALTCATAPDQPDHWQWDDGAKSLERLPMPEHTGAVIRITPEKLDALQVPGLATTDGADASDTNGEPPPAATRLIGWWLQNPHQFVVPRPIWEPDTDYDQALHEWGEFDGIDPTRPAVVAVTSRGAGDVLRYLRYRTFPVGYDATVTGGALRVFVPADDPEALIDDFKAFCDQERTHCNRVEQFTTHGDYAVVDAHRSSWQPGDRLAPENELLPTFDDTDPSYWQNPTPAMKAFLTGDHDFAVHIRSEAIPAFGGLSTVSETIDATVSATPENRAQLLAHGMEMSSVSTAMAGADVREFEDLTLTVDVDGPQQGTVAEVIRSFTDYGARLYEVPAEKPESSADSTDAVIHLQWSATEEPAVDESSLPQWAANHSDETPSATTEAFRDSGIWGYLTVMTGYPSTGLDILPQMTDPEQQLLRDIKMVDFRVDHRGIQRITEQLDDPESLSHLPQEQVFAQLFAEMLDHLVLRVRTGPFWESFADELQQQLTEQMQLPLSVEVQRQDSDLLFTIVHQKAADGKDLAPITPGSAHLQLDPEALPDELRTILTEATPLQPEWVEMLTDFGPSQLDHATFPQGMVTRLQLGADAGSEPVLPADNFEPRPVEVSPECLRSARTLSPDFETFADKPPSERAAAVAQIRDDLSTLRDDCEGDETAESELEWIMSRWQATEAIALAGTRRWEEAADRFKAACDTGYSPACIDAERLDEHTDTMHLPRVDRADTNISALNDGPALISQDYALWATGQWHTRFSLAAMTVGHSDETNLFFQSFEDGEDLTDMHFLVPTADQIIEIETADGAGTVDFPLTSVAVDRTVSSRQLSALLELATGQYLGDQRRRARFSDEEPMPERPVLLGTAVESTTETDEQPLLVWGNADHLDQTDRPPVELEWNDQGITLRVDARQPAPVDGCPTNGLTLCVDDNVSTTLDTVYDGDTDDNVFDEIAARFRLDHLSTPLQSAMDAHQRSDESTPPVFVVNLQRDVPFGALARLHAQLGVWTEQQFDAKPLVVIAQR